MLMKRLKALHKAYAWALGGSIWDVPMLREAHESVVVLGEGPERTNLINDALLDALSTEAVLGPASSSEQPPFGVRRKLVARSAADDRQAHRVDLPPSA